MNRIKRQPRRGTDAGDDPLPVIGAEVDPAVSKNGVRWFFSAILKG